MTQAPAPHQPSPSAPRQPLVAVYPGSFDPITNGHMDIIHRGASLFDTLYVAVAHNIDKRALFSVDERIDMIRECTAALPNVIPDTFSGLLIRYVADRGARVILRGVRAVSDFEFEFQMALMNRKLGREIETVFMMPAEQYSFLSSRLVKEVAGLGGRIDCFVPAIVIPRLLAALGSDR
ncbi:MAG: pantetheine-phosphate adenylyltransferase [Candidatus Schekmanbacteria bacterium]|nr:pantetheine-phosphate adenylyltransferase [Candidatus Schekmanbacteria bacterium]